jgi:hypothetical protein
MLPFATDEGATYCRTSAFSYDDPTPRNCSEHPVCAPNELTIDGSHFDTRYPVVLRFEGFGPENLAGYEKHRKRVGGDLGHALKYRPAPNRILIGSEDWAVKALAEIKAIKAQNFAAELEALEKRNRKKISNSVWRKVRTISGLAYRRITQTNS